MYEKNIRGITFELFAKRYIEAKERLENPELSGSLLEIIKKPKKFLRELLDMYTRQYNNENNVAQKEIIFSKIRGVRKLIDDRDIPEFPHNSDAVAIKTEIGEEGLVVSVLGLLEVKNYNFFKSKEEFHNVIKQQEASKEDTINILNTFAKFLPDFYKSKKIVSPKKITVVPDKKFKQTIIQSKIDNFDSKLTDRVKLLYEKGIEIETIDITPKDFAKICKILEPEIRRRMIELQRSAYRPKL
jgi:hypothetical protein